MYAWATPLAALLLAFAAAAPSAAARVEAYLGERFGVGVVTVPVTAGGPVLPLDDERFAVVAADGRALYPVVKEQPVRRLIRRLLEIDTPATATIYFLFRGEAPLALTAYSPNATTIAVTPLADPAGHRRLLNEWWEAYAARWNQLRNDPKFPPYVENFLAVSLSRRLGLALPEPQQSLLAMFQPQRTVWDDLFSTERRRLEVDRELLFSTSAPGPLGPLPPQMPWVDLPPVAEQPPPADASEELPAPGEDADAVDPINSPIEPIADHVPAECFYVRFGTFTNYLWFRDLNKKWYGDLGNMILRRGIDKASGERIEQQLALKENALAKIVGPQLIADVAIIGLDPYVDQGAAIGILFQAKNSFLLAADLTNERSDALTKFPDGSMTTVQIGGRDVSLASTPGGEIRSYYVADGDFHLVTTSRRLVERFLEAGQGTASLGSTAGFRRVRAQLSGNRGDAVFAYISPELVRQLTSPPVWIESQRRLRAVREMQLVELARLQAQAEGVAATTIGELVDAELLPASFAKHGDGTEIVDGESGWSDSSRGAPGRFTPVSDRPADSATPEEIAAYRRFADRFRQEVGQTPPIAIAIERRPIPTGGETMAAEVLATPLTDVKLGKLRDMLGEPSDQTVPALPGDLIHADAIVKGSPLGGQTEPQHVFLGVRDFSAPMIVRQGRIGGAGEGPLFQFYLGAWPRPGILSLFTGPQLASGAEPAPGLGGAWQAMANEFLVICFNSELVRKILPQLRLAAGDRPAQARVRIENLVGTKLEGTINALGYQRARETSVAACRLMNTLSTQLHEPVAESRATAERLVDGAFVCSLGGEYQSVATPDGRAFWTSTALAPQNQFLLTEAPADFKLPALTWFRGARAEATLTDQAISARIEVDMAASAIP